MAVAAELAANELREAAERNAAAERGHANPPRRRGLRARLRELVLDLVVSGVRR